MNFDSIMGNLIASAIYSILTAIVIRVLYKKSESDLQYNEYPRERNPELYSTVNQNTTLKINNYYRSNHYANNPSNHAEDEFWLYTVGGLVIFALLTFTFSKFKAQIIEFGYITFGFGLLISLLILIAVIKQTHYSELNLHNKIAVTYPVFFWLMFWLNIYNVGNPLMTGNKSVFIEGAIISGGTKGLFSRFWELFSKNPISCYYIIFRAIGVILLIVGLTLMVWMILQFVLKWKIQINQSKSNILLEWVYRKLVIRNMLNFAIANAVVVTTSFLLTSGLLIGIVQKVSDLT